MIKQWSDISEHYGNTLVVGNGGSVAIDPCFSYGSLLDKARELNLITANLQKVFDHVDTNDFELVMNMIWHTQHVNRALEIEEEMSKQAYRDVRQALVQTVRAIHAPYETASPHLPALSSFMRRFKTVVSMNYDLIVYWAMLVGNNEHGNWFKDCFVDGVFREDWRGLRSPYGASGATLVFYPHGNLILASGLSGEAIKVSVSHDFVNLLDTVVQVWESGKYFPLFVSEGSTKQKTDAINRDHYLQTVLHDVVPSLQGTVVVYGWSLSENDQHVLRRLLSPSTTRIAVSIWTGDKDEGDLEAEIEEKTKLIQSINKNLAIDFFDSQSAGSWIYT